MELVLKVPHAAMHSRTVQSCVARSAPAVQGSIGKCAHAPITCAVQSTRMLRHTLDACQSAGGRLRRGGLGSWCGSNRGLDLSIACAIQPHGLLSEGGVVGGKGNHTLAVAYKALSPRLAGSCMHRDTGNHQDAIRAGVNAGCWHCTRQVLLPTLIAAVLE